MRTACQEGEEVSGVEKGCRLEGLVGGDGLLEAGRCGPLQDQQVDLLDGEFTEDAAPPGAAVAPTAVVNAVRVGCGCSGR